jgi:hypothetical protein
MKSTRLAVKKRKKIDENEAANNLTRRPGSLTILEMKKKFQSQIAKKSGFSRGVPSGYKLIVKDTLNC